MGINKTDLYHYSGHRRRLKEKYKSGGLDTWLDYEVIEFALSFAIPRRDTKQISKALIARFGTLSGILEANKEELQSISGINEHTTLFIHLLKDIARLYLKNTLLDKDLVSSPELVVNYLKASLKGGIDEEFHSLFLNKSNRLITAETIQKGTVDKAIIHPRKIVERALHNHAASIIIAHNHPGGSVKPSVDDYNVTDMIKNALKTVEISLLDHIIISSNNYFSFKEQNLI